MSNARNSGRRANDAPRFQPGQPAREDRNQRRAYEYQQRRAAEENWAAAREWEERPRSFQGPTVRSTQWKNRKNEKKVPKKEDAAVAMDFRAKDETSPVDEPLYDLGPHGSSIPVQELYSQNFEVSGFIDQVERTYETLRGIDPRLDKRMPFSMFQHSMTTVLNCHLLDVAYENGERKLGNTKCQDLLPEDLCMPDNLYHYMTTIGNTTTSGGEEVRFDLPDAAVPQGPVDGAQSGSFGELTALNHNVYECYISPLVTSNRVLNSRRAARAADVPTSIACYTNTSRSGTYY